MRAMILITVCLLCGCSTVSTEFIDIVRVNGDHETGFRQELMVAPFSQLGEQVAQMSYQWTDTGAGNIAVGTATTNLDNTGQTEALAVGVAAALAYLATQATGPIP